VYSSSQGCHTATETHMPHGITQCYLPPGRGDIPALTPAKGVAGAATPQYLTCSGRPVLTTPQYFDKCFIFFPSGELPNNVAHVLIDMLRQRSDPGGMQG